MKKNIHPKYYDNCQVTCTCGNSFTTGSTLPEIKVDICSSCHPFFTGETKYVDRMGRVEKFQKKQAKAAAIKKQASSKIKIEKKKQARPRTLKEMLKT